MLIETMALASCRMNQKRMIHNCYFTRIRRYAMKKALSFVLVTVLALAGPVGAVSASPRVLPEIVGQIGGSSYAVAVQGDYAYLGVGPRLVVLDISDPSDPTMLGQTDVLGDVVV
jgi:hypothetical protein